MQRGLSCPSNIQIIQAFLIQASYSVWRQLFYKHSDIQIIQNLFHSRQHCSVASAFSIHTAISSEIAFLVSLCYARGEQGSDRPCDSDMVDGSALLI